MTHINPWTINPQNYIEMLQNDNLKGARAFVGKSAVKWLTFVLSHYSLYRHMHTAQVSESAHAMRAKSVNQSACRSRIRPGSFPLLSHRPTVSPKLSPFIKFYPTKGNSVRMPNWSGLRSESFLKANRVLPCTQKTRQFHWKPFM